MASGEANNQYWPRVPGRISDHGASRWLGASLGPNASVVRPRPNRATAGDEPAVGRQAKRVVERISPPMSFGDDGEPTPPTQRRKIIQPRNLVI